MITQIVSTKKTLDSPINITYYPKTSYVVMSIIKNIQKQYVRNVIKKFRIKALFS